MIVASGAGISLDGASSTPAGEVRATCGALPRSAGPPAVPSRQNLRCRGAFGQPRSEHVAPAVQSAADAVAQATSDSAAQPAAGIAAQRDAGATTQRGTQSATICAQS